MKYILTILFSLALVSPVYATTTNYKPVITDEGSNAGNVSTGLSAVLTSQIVANPPAGTYSSAQTVTLSAPEGSKEVRYVFNTTDLTLTCNNGNIYDASSKVSIPSTGLLRAIACYGTIATPVVSFNYKIDGGTTPSGGSNSGGAPSGGNVGGGSSYTPPTVAQADFNSDGKVDILDFNILITNWGTTSGATKAMGDANNDGKVDIFDFNILINNWPTI